MNKSIFHQDSYIFTNNSDIKKIISKLNINFNQDKIINVVGTNGKGSTSYYLYQGLIDAGYNVGLFTSPHIFSPCEMVETNHLQINPKQAKKIAQQIIKICPKVDNFNTFVKWYLIALIHFQNTKCDYIILEACMGGENDMTNTINSTYGVVTSIAEDHLGVIGNNKEEIAKNKSGIIKNEMQFCIPSFLDENITQVFIDECKNMGASYFIANNDDIDYQVRNSKLAKECLKHFFNVDYQKNFKNLPGRTEFFLLNNCECILDVGHNLDGVKESLNHIKNKNKNFEQVVVMLGGNKEDIDFASLFQGKQIFYFKNKIPDIVYHPNFFFKSFEFQEIKNMKNFIEKLNKKTLFIGSFHLIGEIWKIIQKIKKNFRR